MKAATRVLIATIAAFALSFLGGAKSVMAQPAPCPWPGPISIVNNSTVNVSISLKTNPQIVAPITVNSGATVNVPITVNTTVTGITANSGTVYAWLAPPPAWRLLSVDLDGSGPCFDVVYNPATCTVTITMSTTGPPCTNP